MTPPIVKGWCEKKGVGSDPLFMHDHYLCMTFLRITEYLKSYAIRFSYFMYLLKKSTLACSQYKASVRSISQTNITL